jgi:hypothetical protein
MGRTFRGGLLAGAIACVAAWTVGASLAQRAPDKQPPEAIQAARDVLVAMGSEKQFDVVVPMMTQQLSQLLKSQRPGAGREIDEVFGLLAKRFAERKGEMLDLVAPLYAARFSVQELREMLAFFKTPVGAKLAAELPAISQESMRVGMAWGQKIGQEIDQEARRELKKRGIDL